MMYKVFAMWRALVIHRTDCNQYQRGTNQECSVPRVYCASARKARKYGTKICCTGTSGARYTGTSGAWYPELGTGAAQYTGTGGARYPMVFIGNQLL